METRSREREKSHFTFDLLHRRQLPLPIIVEGARRHGLKIDCRVLAHPVTRRVAALAHTRMIPQATLVQVRMRQRVSHCYPFVLTTNNTKLVEYLRAPNQTLIDD